MPGLLLAQRDAHGLEAGFAAFDTGFIDAGLPAVPVAIKKLVTESGHENYNDFIISKMPGDSRYWAPEIRHTLSRRLLLPVAFQIVEEAQRTMSLELERRVNDSNDTAWTDDIAKRFAREKAGVLLLHLLGNLRH